MLESKSRYDEILLCEGWRDCLAAVALGFYATANCGGCSFHDFFLPVFRDKKVRIIFDRDKAGVHGAERAAKAIFPIAQEVKIINLPYPVTESGGKDLFDWKNE